MKNSYILLSVIICAFSASFFLTSGRFEEKSSSLSKSSISDLTSSVPVGRKVKRQRTVKQNIMIARSRKITKARKNKIPTNDFQQIRVKPRNHRFDKARSQNKKSSRRIVKKARKRVISKNPPKKPIANPKKPFPEQVSFPKTIISPQVSPSS